MRHRFESLLGFSMFVPGKPGEQAQGVPQGPAACAAGSRGQGPLGSRSCVGATQGLQTVRCEDDYLTGRVL